RAGRVAFQMADRPSAQCGYQYFHKVHSEIVLAVVAVDPCGNVDNRRPACGQKIDVITSIKERRSTMSILGLEKLTLAQQELMHRVHARHLDCQYPDRRAGMHILAAWVDPHGCVCVRLANGEWYHYRSTGDWD
ncbi:MAG: hypothetical protein JXR88_03700, partial [Clostridia bacterium]|nr:hypothetical protein [Clostridia bacterium]